MNAKSIIGFDFTQPINRPADNIHDSTKSRLTDGNRDWLAGVDDCACCGYIREFRPLDGFGLFQGKTFERLRHGQIVMSVEDGLSV